MITEAYISGRLGEAIYFDDKRCLLLTREFIDKPVECYPYNYNLFFSSCTEIEYVSGHKTIDELRELLIATNDKYDALHFFIGGMDASSEESTRTLGIELADELFIDKNVFAFVSNRLLARLLTDDTDIEKAIAIAGNIGATVPGTLYKETLESQVVISEVLFVWAEVSLKLNVEEMKRKEMEKALIDGGAFASFVKAVRAKDAKAMNLVVANAYFNRSLKEKMAGVMYIFVLNDMKNMLHSRLSIATERWDSELLALHSIIRQMDIIDELFKLKCDRCGRIIQNPKKFCPYCHASLSASVQPLMSASAPSLNEHKPPSSPVSSPVKPREASSPLTASAPVESRFRMHDLELLRMYRLEQPKHKTTWLVISIIVLLLFVFIMINFTEQGKTLFSRFLTAVFRFR